MDIHRGESSRKSCVRVLASKFLTGDLTGGGEWSFGRRVRELAGAITVAISIAESWGAIPVAIFIAESWV